MKAASNWYQGYEVIKHRFIMTGKMYVEVGIACLVFQIALFIFAAIFFVDDLHRELAWKYPLARVATFLRYNPIFHLPFHGKISAITGSDIASLDTSVVYVGSGWFMACTLSFGAWFLALPMLRFFGKTTAKIKEDEHIRGARLTTEKDIAKEARAAGEKGILPIGSKIILPEAFEGRHLLIAGQTGSGKTTPIFQMIDAIQEADRGEGRRALVHDIKCEFVQKFFRPNKDLILNPLDARGLGWTLFNELQSRPDLSAIAGSLIPPGKGDDRFWSAAAADVFRGLLAHCYNEGKRTNAQLWAALTSPIADIAAMCKSTPSGQAGYSYIQDASGKQAAGVIAVLMSYVSWLEWATDGPFSLRQWAATPSGQTIYMTTREEVQNTLKPYLSLFADLLGKRLLALPDNLDKPEHSIYMILDEINNLQKLPTVKRMLTLGRSKKIKNVLGAQEIAGFEAIYGREDTRTVVNNCATKMIFNVGDSDTAEFYSRLAGQEEYWQASTTYSISQTDAKGGENHTRQIQKRDVIMASEIMLLPVGHCYTMLPAGNPALVEIPWMKVNKRAVVNEGFILRPGLSLDDVEVMENEIVSRARDVIETPVPDELKNKVEENTFKRAREEKEVEEKSEQQRSAGEIQQTVNNTLML